MIKKTLPLLLISLLFLNCASQGPKVKDGYIDYTKVTGYLFKKDMAFSGESAFYAITTQAEWEKHFEKVEDTTRSSYFDFKDENPLILAIVFHGNSLWNLKPLSLQAEDGSLVFEYSSKAIQENLPAKKYYTLIITTDLLPFKSVKFLKKDKVVKEIPLGE